MTVISVPCRRHDAETWDQRADEWVCDKCGNRRPVLRGKDGRPLARQGSKS